MLLNKAYPVIDTLLSLAIIKLAVKPFNRGTKRRKFRKFFKNILYIAKYRRFTLQVLLMRNHSITTRVASDTL